MESQYILKNPEDVWVFKNISFEEGYNVDVEYIKMWSCFLDSFMLLFMLFDFDSNSRIYKVLKRFVAANVLYYINHLVMSKISLANDELSNSFIETMLTIMKLHVVMSHMAAFLCVILLSSEFMMSSKISDHKLMSYSFVLFIVLFIVQLFLMLFTSVPFHSFIPTVIFLSSIFIVFFNDLTLIYKYIRGIPIGVSTVFRMNISRIYVYSWLLIVICSNFTTVLSLKISLIGYFHSLLIFAYLSTYGSKIWLILKVKEDPIDVVPAVTIETIKTNKTVEISVDKY
ncbi:PREDICTED: uncharacterized protein LOC108569942 [Nicrophorus vespilloides]|uniref:Uncharacterized protein LOC108569942 n=1 Tax=Nicrophorus vespilloides TaxID=110193 RepID=A0ABM1NK62_NICVS|nr:PREDICTED: uncharacterized protein LOC108569942 [Nicrophorus vespilloides]